MKLTTFGALLLTVIVSHSTIYAQDQADREGVRMAVLDYVEGIYNVEPSRIERSVSSKLAKSGFYRGPNDQTYRDSSVMTFEQLVKLAGSWNKDGKLRKDAPKEITIFDVLDKTATAKLVAEWGIDYLHLAKLDGKWMIVNVIWQSPMK
ncbi:MAG TPA: nuclear transport factor 2 family protein [Pyrinomonadaceae bacterium]